MGEDTGLRQSRRAGVNARAVDRSVLNRRVPGWILHLLDQLNVDVAFTGTIGLSTEAGLTTTDPAEAYSKELLMAKARDIILLADSTKPGRVSFAQAGRLDRVRTLITNGKADQQVFAELRKKGIEVIQV